MIHDVTSPVAFAVLVVVLVVAATGWTTGWLSAAELSGITASVFLGYAVRDALDHRSAVIDLVLCALNTLLAVFGRDDDKPRRRRRDLARKARLRVFGPGFVPAPLKTGA